VEGRLSLSQQARSNWCERRGVIAHDVTLILRRPKIAPHRDAMRADREIPTSASTVM
jgi:hypothetical protein